jgi:hypothetical protein
MLSSAFWEYAADTDIGRDATGFMRTYTHLIKYEIDFEKAQSMNLIPTEKHITYEGFAMFIEAFEPLDDEVVSARYRYGEMRLTRLNWCARLYLRKLTFHHIHAHWNEYIGSILGPVLTIFVLVAAALNAMQVELAVQSTPQSFGSWLAFSRMCR